MKFYITLLVFAFLCIIVQSSPTSSYSTNTKVSDVKTGNQTKRDISLSYAATDIDSKEGTRVKTITVIKNVGGASKQQPLEINSELHKNEEWGSAFRDNFDSYGKIPDVPDIEDLFEFMKKSSSKDATLTEAPQVKSNENPKLGNSTGLKDVPPVDEDLVEKIKGDAELVPSSSNKMHSMMNKSEPLAKQNYRVHESAIDVNYSMPIHSLQGHFDQYVQSDSDGYTYEKPCEHAFPESITVNTASGRSFNIPANNSNRKNPYIAPAVAKKAHPQDNRQSVNSPVDQSQYSLNSLLLPLAEQVGSNIYPFLSDTLQQHPKSAGFSTTSPFVYPNRWNGLLKSRGPSGDQKKFHTYLFGPGSTKTLNNSRSRGLKY